jgi:Ala-tRNA(Pro) deacylase
MAIPKKIINFLEKNKVKYEVIKHKTVYTALDKAATLKTPKKIIGKTLLLKLDKKPALVIIPADKNLDKQKLKKIAKAKEIDFIKENWMKKNLKGLKVGAIPPFASLWKMSIFGEKNLFSQPKIIINSGDYSFSIRINPKDFKKICPDIKIGNFSQIKK